MTWFYNTDPRRLVFSSFICQFFVEHEAAEKLRESCARPCPESFASLPSYLTFSWITSLIWTGYRRPLTSGQLRLLKGSFCTRNASLFQGTNKGPSII